MLALTFLIALGILELGLFVIGPLLQSYVSPTAANVFYVLLRVATIITFSFLCVRRHGRNLYHALSFTGFLIFLDQVLFKSLWLILDMKRNPALWQGVDPKSAIYNSAFSYVVSLPVILLLAFIGVMLALKKAAPRR